MEVFVEAAYMRKYLFENIRQWALAAIKFLMAVHYFACGWILIHNYKRVMELPYVEFSDNNSTFVIYFEAVYLMTTTISTVGYGDFKGYVDSEGEWAPEMSYLFFVTLSGIILFASVTREIFAYKKLLTVKQIVTSRVSAMEHFLYDVNQQIKGKSLPSTLIVECKEHIKESIKSATRFYFEENEFY